MLPFGLDWLKLLRPHLSELCSLCRIFKTCQILRILRWNENYTRSRIEKAQNKTGEMLTDEHHVFLNDVGDWLPSTKPSARFQIQLCYSLPIRKRKLLFRKRPYRKTKNIRGLTNITFFDFHILVNASPHTRDIMVNKEYC